MSPLAQSRNDAQVSNMMKHIETEKEKIKNKQNVTKKK
jgi:hypothetical protein